MKKLIVSFLVVICITACSQKKQNQLPAPTSVATMVSTLKGKTFIAERIGTVSPFATSMDKEKPNRWFDEEKELNDFAKEYQEERMKLVFQFVNDTLLRITDDGKTWDAFYKIDEQQKEDEKAGIKLRFSYEDKEGNMNFPGATGPVMLTSTYLIAGATEKEIVVETPRQFNRSTVVLWMIEKK